MKKQLVKVTGVQECLIFLQCDKREPSVIRIAPAPLYCSFYDVYRFMKYLEDALQAAYAAE